MFLDKFSAVARQHTGVRGILFSAALLAMLLNGCVVTESQKTPVVVAIPAPPPSKPLALTEEAETILKAAEQSVIEARIKRALWTAAVTELERARAASKMFDSVATSRHAREVITLCGLSVAQLSAAPVSW